MRCRDESFAKESELTRKPIEGQDAKRQPKVVPKLWVGLDLGTTSVKAAAWWAPSEPSAERTPAPSSTPAPTSAPLAGRTQLAAPPLETWRGLKVQDPLALAYVAEQAVAEVVAKGVAMSKVTSGPISAAMGEGATASPFSREAGWVQVVFTAQRDTLLWVDPDGTPQSPLLSWRVRAHLEDLGLRGALLAGRQTGKGDRTAPEGAFETFTPLPLEDWLLRRWARGVPGAGVCPAQFAGGDKNCEYRAFGVGAPGADPGLGALSLGTAITLGMSASGPAGNGVRPVAHRGAVVSPDGKGAWHVETGVLSGVGGLDLALAAAGVASTHTGGTPPDSPWDDEVFVFPHDGGAVDDGGRTGRVFAPHDAGPTRIQQGWMLGVAAELRRLRPALEATAGTPLRALWVGGEGWGELLSAILDLPVTEVGDPLMGCRGAVEGVWPHGRVEGAPEGKNFVASPARVARASHWFDRWMALGGF